MMTPVSLAHRGISAGGCPTTFTGSHLQCVTTPCFVVEPYFIPFTAICLWVCCFWKSILSINDNIIFFYKSTSSTGQTCTLCIAQHTSKFGNQSASGEAFPPLRLVESPRKLERHVRDWNDGKIKGQLIYQQKTYRLQVTERSPRKIM